MKEVLNTVREVSGRNFTVVEADRRPGDPPVLVSSYRKAADLLGWTPRYTDMSSIVETAFNWHAKNV